jgi:hypothetical protein
MNLAEWSKSNIDYGLKLVNSAVEGARHGEDEFLKKEPLAPFLSDSAKQALTPAGIGACLGLLCGYVQRRRRPETRILAYGFVGAAIGFGAGVIWKSRRLTASVASTVGKSIRETRDERWFEKNPIDYA